MGGWDRKRAEAATRALAEGASAEDALRAGDRAVGGVVPMEEYQQLALDLSSWKVRAQQAEELLERTLDALDQIAGADEGAEARMRDVAFGTGTEVRALLGAQREPQGDDAA